MTDTEIIKAFECCYTDADCEECPLYSKENHKCTDIGAEINIPKKILDLINRLKAENEKLVNIPPKDPMDFCGVVCNYAEELIEKAKSEARKEFAERLKEELIVFCDRVCEESGLSIYGVITGYPIDDVEECIDNLLKEMG